MMTLMKHETARCDHCNQIYSWPKSSSALRFSYCSMLCERMHTGYTIEGWCRDELVSIESVIGKVISGCDER